MVGLYREYKIHKDDLLYQESPSGWHRYGDILVPLITLPLLAIIGITLHSIVVDDWKNDQFMRCKVLVLSISLLITSFTVFCYVCIRLRTILGGKRSRIRLPMIRSRTNNSILKSVNSDLHLILPFNHAQQSYDTIVLNIPPPYYSTFNLNETEKTTGQKKLFAKKTFMLNY